MPQNTKQCGGFCIYQGTPSAVFQTPAIFPDGHVMLAAFFEATVLSSFGLRIYLKPQ